jgi:hypothetical protein
MSIEEEWEGAEKLWGLVGCVEPGEIDLTKTVRKIKEDINNRENISIDELQDLQEKEKEGKNRGGVHNLINVFIGRINGKGTKAGNGGDEAVRLKWMYGEINNHTEWGIKFKKDYNDFFNKGIGDFEVVGGMSNHYDFLIHHTDGSKVRCEEKGNKDKYDLLKSIKPWSKAVQRYNGPAKWAECVCKPFAELWYDKIVSNEDINKEIGNTLQIPQLEDWYADCTALDPKTEWGKENKKNVKEKYKDGTKKISLNGKNGVPIDGRELIIDYFKEKFSGDLKEQLKQLIQNKLNYVMNEKDIWITTCGQVPNIEYRFWNKIEPEKVTDIKIKYNKGADIIFECIVENEKDNFECYLRWGKGCGFSNLRFDIR